MKVARIVSNIATSDMDTANAFYTDVLGLEVLMDLGWIRTYGSDSKMTIQVSGDVRRGTWHSCPGRVD